ncbi:hypothetical protein ACFQ08_26755, partial [Streptosporangium algeriense]
MRQDRNARAVPRGRTGRYGPAIPMIDAGHRPRHTRWAGRGREVSWRGRGTGREGPVGGRGVREMTAADAVAVGE